jgi:hypothetical protein
MYFVGWRRNEFLFKRNVWCVVEIALSDLEQISTHYIDNKEKMKTYLILVILCLFAFATSFAQKNSVQYDTISQNLERVFTYSDTLNNSYLRQLRTEYQLLNLIENKSSDLEKVLAVLDWTHNQWKHNGSNEPSRSDAITILKEAKEGKKFRCVEYGIVATAALQCINYEARVIALKTKDVETTQYGAGHVLAEVWMPQFSKWVLIDGQFNTIPVLEGIPLNAVEFQQAIAEKKEYKLMDLNGEVSKKRRKNYLSFIFDYLYYVDTKFDTRNLPANEQLTYQGKSSLMLVPIGAKSPTIFQKKYPINDVIYTNSLKDFYQIP